MKLIHYVLICIAILILPHLTYAQPGMGNVKEYEIGNIKVKGARHSDENSIIAVSGLTVGEKIKVPGNEVQRAIKSLWDLRLFEDVEINVVKTIGDVIVLEIAVRERPRLTRYDFIDIRKSHVEDIKEDVRDYLLKGGIVTEDAKRNTRNAVERYYVGKGFLDAKAEVKELPDENLQNGIKLEIRVDKGQRIKIKDIVFEGVENAKPRKLRKVMKETKRRARIFAGSKLKQKEYEGDKRSIVDYYNTIGHRDASILGDSIWREGKKDHLMIKIKVDEGRKYYFRDITFKGNSIYADSTLELVMGINPGDVYNQELLDTRLNFSEDGRDVSSLYMDNGYLFFNVDPVEKAIDNDSIDLEIRIFEGPQATINSIIIQGNTRTHEHVIRRELRTRPGQKFSRSDIIRSQREIVSLGYFNPEALGINPIPNLQRGTVDIEYTVEEKSSDQLELSAGWGGRGRGVIGTLGVTFNNFSLRNILKKESWSPLPQGDGQRLSVRAQTNGRFYQSYNFSFTEPWLGGKKPNSFTTSMFFSLLTNGGDRDASTFESLAIIGSSVGLGTRLKWPDDYFVSSTTLSLQSYKLRNWRRGGFSLSDGTPVLNGRYNNFALQQTISRNSVDNPIFPKSGANLSLTGSFTPPYSLFRKVEDFNSLDSDEQRQDWAASNLKWLEYHKWKLKVEWYHRIVGNLTVKLGGKFGLLGYYNKNIGLSPFERFELGGDGISNQFVGIAGRDIVSMRGYDVGDLAANNSGGAAVFNKLTVELRYPLTLNPSSTVYVLGFFEGGNAWSSLKDYNPFDMRRSVGAGVRVFLPMFGTLGFDYGIGFDKDNTLPAGAKLSEYGRFNIILGFEAE
jgi:outer membrane protein insertion porin family